MRWWYGFSLFLHSFVSSTSYVACIQGVLSSRRNMEWNCWRGSMRTNVPAAAAAACCLLMWWWTSLMLVAAGGNLATGTQERKEAKVPAAVVLGWDTGVWEGKTLVEWWWWPSPRPAGCLGGGIKCQQIKATRGSLILLWCWVRRDIGNPWKLSGTLKWNDSELFLRNTRISQSTGTRFHEKH